MLKRRFPYAKWTFAAWVISGPLNLVVLLSLANYFFVTDELLRFSSYNIVMLATACSFGMGLVAFRLRAGGESYAQIHRTVLKAALLTAAITIVLLVASLEILGWNEPSFYPDNPWARLESLLSMIPIFVFAGLLFAIPAALYGAGMYAWIGYERETDI